jgi:iron complex transport system permease protein
MRLREIRTNILITLVVLLVVILVVASIGNVTVPIKEFFVIIASKIPWVRNMVDTGQIIDSHETIVLNLRLPRIILSMFAGFGLAYSGVVYQGVFRNPMAEPYLLGVSSGAALGATIASIFPLSVWFLGFSYVSILAFFGAISVLYLIFMITRSKGSASMNFLLLAGLAINYFISSMISLLMMFNQDKISDIYYWTMGSFRTASYEKIMVLGIIVALTIILTYPMHKNLDIMLLGDEQALSLGVDVAKVKKRLLVITSFMTAVIVASCGIIGFVGLIIPHVVRLFVGPSHKKLLIHSTFLGGVFLILSDTLARSLLENKEISVGIITSIFGVPFFIWMLMKNKQKL